MSVAIPERRGLAAAPAFRGLAALLAFPALLAGCSVNTPPRLLTSQSIGTLPARVQIDSPATPEAQRFSAALQQGLAAKGIAIAPEADVVITLALSQRPAAMGIAQEGRGNEGVRWLAPPRPKRIFDACSAEQMQVIVVAKPKAAAQPLYAGRGAFMFCTLAPEKLDSMASAFAGAMLAQ